MTTKDNSTIKEKFSNKMDPHEIERNADEIDLAAAEEPVRHLRSLKLVRQALKLEDFPMTRTEIDYCVGDIDVEDGQGGFIPVFQLTDEFKQDQFESPEDVILALKKARRAFKHPAA